METKITKHYFEHGTNKYFRGNAINAFIGTYGKRRNPVGPKAYLDPQNKIKREHLAGKVSSRAAADIDWSRTNESEFAGDGFLKFFGFGGTAAVSTNYQKAKNLKLKLMQLVIDPGPLTRILNQHADGARKWLAEAGGDGRVVGEIWVLTDAELVQTFSTATSVSASVNAAGKGLDITASNGAAGSQTITVHDSTFAYMLYKVKDWNRDKTRIEELVADWKGIG